MATTIRDIEAGSTFENRRWIGETLQALRFLVRIGPALLLFYVILVIAFNFLLPKYLPPTWIIEAPLVLLALNTLFLSIIPFVVAMIALQGYMQGGSADLLFLGCGMLSFSSACFVAGWLGAQAQANVNLTIHNTGVLLASVFNLLAGVSLYFRKSARRGGEKKKKAGIFAYVGILIFTAGLSFATLRGYTPAFNVPGSGPTLLREAVLMAATILFGLSCLLIVIFDRDRRSFFLSCYALALGLITIGLVALMTYKRTNSPLAWLGRSAQYAAGIYFLAAVVAAVRAAWANRWTVPDAVRDFLRPSEALYRDLVETATDAIIPISTSGEILLWNAAAEQIFGYNRMEALRIPLSDLIDSEDSKRLFQEIETGQAPVKGSCIGQLRTVKGRRKSGEEFPAELSFSSRRLSGGSISTLIIRDITDRKKAEDALRAANERALWLARFPEENPNPVARVSADGTVLYCNPSALTLPGCPCAVGQPLDVRLMPLVSQAISRGHEQQQDIEIEKRSYLFWVTPFLGEGYVNIYGRDITERKQAEATLDADLAALTRMHALSGRLLEQGGLQSMLQEIMDSAIAIMGADKGTLQLVEKDSLRIVAHHGHQQPFLDFFSAAENVASVCGEATRRGKRVIVPDVEASSLFVGTPSLEVLREAGVRTVQSTPMISRTGALMGILTTQWRVPHNPNEHDLWRVDLLVRQAAELIELVRAEEELRKSRDELEVRVQERTKELRESEFRLRQLSTALLNAQERERKLIALEIHDSLGASLAAVKFKVEDAFKNIGNDNPSARAELEKVIPLLQETIQEVRRIQMSLRPSILDDLGILPAINWFCRQYESIYPSINVIKDIDIQEHEVPISLRIDVFRVFQEAMNNIAKHSKADHINLLLRKKDGAIELGIQDNGQGFDLSQAQSRMSISRGLGLDSMRERAELSGGSFSIESGKGSGTLIRATWPLNT